MTEIAEAYIHLRPFSVSESTLRAIGRSADSIAYSVAREIYGPTVNIEVKLEAGSLKGRIMVIASSAFLLYGGIADYKGFKESVAEMCADARSFGADVCGKFTKAAGASKRQVYRTERRLKTPGRIARVIDRLERLQRQLSDLSPRQVQQELYDINRQLEQIVRDLPPEDAELLEEQVELKGLPPIRNWPQRAPKGQVDLPKVALLPRSNTQQTLPEMLADENHEFTTKPTVPLLIYHNRFSTEHPPDKP
jgi:hypothetical protein